MPNALVTGCAGFIGYHVCNRLLREGYDVYGIDAMTDYYDPKLKRARINDLHQTTLSLANKFQVTFSPVEDTSTTIGIAVDAQPDVIIHLAAQAGVRHSLEHPEDYVEANLRGTFSVLQAVRVARPKHLMMASTSSVYGANKQSPLRETANTDMPMSFYAATKKANEVMAHSYAHIYSIPTTMMRFFTVYGPWGRPDMALFKFVSMIKRGEPIDVYNYGQMRRDFTYIDDVVEAVFRTIRSVPVGPPLPSDTLSPVAPFRTLNMGLGRPVALMGYIAAIEAALGRSAEHNLLPMQSGDTEGSPASTDLQEQLLGHVPHTPLHVGIRNFIDWYEDYYKDMPK